MRRWWCLLLVAAVGAAGCGSSTNEGTTAVVRWDQRAADFWSAPFPGEDLRRADGTIDLSAFQNPTGATLVDQMIALISRSAHGFAETGGVFFPMSAALDPAALPDLAASVTPGATVFLMGVTSGAPDYLKRYPVEVTFIADAYPYGPINLLSIVPLQGIPLRPHTTYAAVVLRSARDTQGNRLGVAPAIQSLIDGGAPDGLPARAVTLHAGALAALSAAGVDPHEIAAFTAYTTDDPVAQFDLFAQDVLARQHPAIEWPWAADESFADYCVFHTKIRMPDYQSGFPPFSTTGGEWLVDGAGKPIMQRLSESNLVVTVPKRAVAGDHVPVVILVRTGAGGDRPLVDRGAADANGVTIAGTGPALELSKAGFAGITVDGPLGGLRNPSGNITQEQYLVFNVANPAALRDNVRESALELVLLAHVLDDLTPPDCAGAGTVGFDTTHVALMGHSMGGTISGVAFPSDTRFGAAVLSGFGGSYIENVLYKKDPLDVYPLAQVLLRDTGLSAGDPILSMVQWAEEPSDPPVFARKAAGRHVLMEQGIVDHYITPRIANAGSLALGLDLAGTPLDGNTGLDGQISLVPLLPFSGRRQITFPVSGNLGGGTATAIVVQHPGDGIQDGHEIIFQTQAPKHEIKCFLASYATGLPRVPAGTTLDAACP